jgi:hypothetical protein
MKKLLPLLMLLLGVALLLASCKDDPPPEPTTARAWAATTTALPTTEPTLPPEETTAEAPPTTTTTKATDEPMTTTDDGTPRRELATPAEIRAEERRASSVLSSLKAGEIDKIVLEQTRPTAGGAERFTYESASPEAVAAWVNVFDAMELSGAQFEFLSGGNLAVYAVAGGSKVELGCLEGGYLTNGRLKTMCRIDNYDALYGDIKSAAALVSNDVVV